ncbi:MAG: M48 family metallopeptidase [Clostridia bacterium]|nr:M48 family metallopeptidase [Clostridia bacterium]
MKYQIIRSNRKTVAIQVKGEQVIVRAPLRVRDADIQKFVTEHSAWIEKQLKKVSERAKQYENTVPLSREQICELTETARRVIPERVKYFAPLVDVDYGRITIRSQRSRWGSCSGKGNLNFNCLLMLAPPEVLDSVVVHELCHRKQMNHSELFYREVLRVCPEYHKYNAWLKENGPALLRRLPQ